jgi:hypothetical protein
VISVSTAVPVMLLPEIVIVAVSSTNPSNVAKLAFTV